MGKRFAILASCMLAGVSLFISSVSAQETGKIRGIVYTVAAKDSTPLANATVILFTGGSGGGQTPVDTTTTNSAGIYWFLKVPVATNYRIIGSASAHVPDTARQIKVTVNDTTEQNLYLPNLPAPTYGSISVFVGKSTDSSAISGASVTALLQGNNEAFMGTSNASGWAVFNKVPAGTYSVTAVYAAYAAKKTSTTVSSNEKDTVKIFLLASTTPTRTISGTVKNASGSAINNAQILVKVGGGGSGSSFSFSAVTNSSGVYSVSGIPTTYTEATVTVSATAYLDTVITNFNIADMNTTLNIVLRASPVNTISTMTASQSINAATVSLMNNQMLCYCNEPSATVTLLTINGKTILQKIVLQGHSVISLPLSVSGSQILLVKIKGQSNKVSYQLLSGK